MRPTRQQRDALVWLKRHGGIVCTNTPDITLYDALTQGINPGYVQLRRSRTLWRGPSIGYNALALTRRGWQIAHRG